MVIWKLDLGFKSCPKDCFFLWHLSQWLSDNVLTLCLPVPYQIQVKNRNILLCLLCTYYVPFDFRHKIGIPIVYLIENLEIFYVPIMCLCGLSLFFMCLFCAFLDLDFF